MADVSPWYQSRWWYVERPFPWLLVAVYAVPVAIIAVILMIVVSCG